VVVGLITFAIHSGRDTRSAEIIAAFRTKRTKSRCGVLLSTDILDDNLEQHMNYVCHVFLI
jgi:hypothetical protein